MQVLVQQGLQRPREDPVEDSEEEVVLEAELAVVLVEATLAVHPEDLQEVHQVVLDLGALLLPVAPAHQVVRVALVQGSLGQKDHHLSPRGPWEVVGVLVLVS